ncbi:MAG: hypothetical protein EPO32_04985 [Anaerolineae bacterium]|nr:MAG: hypothetical protein EPO32_04985 [Anaerolineae bacterium]
MLTLKLAVKAAVALALVVATALTASPEARGRLSNFGRAAVRSVNQINENADLHVGGEAGGQVEIDGQSQLEGEVAAEDSAAVAAGDSQADGGTTSDAGASAQTWVQVGLDSPLVGLLGNGAVGLHVEDTECGSASVKTRLVWDPQTYLKAAADAGGTLRLYRDGSLIAELDHETSAYVDTAPLGDHEYRLEYEAAGTVYWQVADGGTC